MATSKENMDHAQSYGTASIVAVATTNGALLNDSKAKSDIEKEVVDSKTAADGAGVVPISSQSLNFSKALKDIFEQCQGRILYKQSLMEWSREASESELCTYWMRKHNLRFRKTINNRKDFIQKKIADELLYEITQYKRVCDRITAGIALVEAEDLYILIKKIGFARRAENEYLEKLMLKINSTPEWLFSNSMIHKLKIFFSKEFSEIVEGFAYDNKYERIGINIEKPLNMFVVPIDKFLKLFMSIFEEGKTHKDVPLIGTLCLLIIDYVNPQIVFTLGIEAAKIVKKKQEAFQANNFEQNIKEIKNLTSILRDLIAPLHIKIKQWELFAENLKTIKKLQQNINSSLDLAAHLLNEFKVKSHTFHPNVILSVKLAMEKISILVSLIVDVNQSSTVQDILNNNMDLTEKMHLIIDDLHGKKMILDDKFAETKQFLLQVERESNEVKAKESGHSHPSPSSSSVAVQAEQITRSFQKENAEINKQSIVIDWKKFVEERRAALNAERALRKRAKVVEDLRMAAQKKVEEQTKVQIVAVDLKAREESVKQRLRVNPTIKQLFSKLYARQNSFAHDDLMALINALKLQNFNISIDFRDSHYTVVIEGTYGEFGENEFTEKAKAVKTHNTDRVIFSRRTILALQHLFKRTGFSEALIFANVDVSVNTNVHVNANPDTHAAAALQNTAAAGAITPQYLHVVNQDGKSSENNKKQVQAVFQGPDH